MAVSHEAAGGPRVLLQNGHDAVRKFRAYRFRLTNFRYAARQSLSRNAFSHTATSQNEQKSYREDNDLSPMVSGDRRIVTSDRRYRHMS